VRGTVLVLHGVRLDKHSMIPTAAALSDAGFRSVLVDLRGHGRSSGSYLTYGVLEARDLSQLLDALAAKKALGPVGAYGFSYGAATALHLAERDPRIAAVVAVSAFSSLRGAVRDYVVRYAPALEPGVPNAWLDGAIDLGGRLAAFDPDAAAPARAVARSRAPLLIVHGAADEQVPPYHAAVLEREAKKSGRQVEKTLLTLDDHAGALNDDKARAAACAWLGRKLGEKARDPLGVSAPEKL
jgi:pimeloyl-ACP methyl ester carboxylesterase